MRRIQISNYLIALPFDSLVARTRAGRSSYAFLHVSAYGPEFSRQRVVMSYVVGGGLLGGVRR